MSSQGALRDWNGPGFELIETLRWEADLGFVRLERHLARLQASARVLGFACSAAAAEAALAQAADEGAAAAQPGQARMLRLRLTLDPAGRAAATALPLVLTRPNTVWRVKIAAARLDSADPLLRHKTSRRAVYDAARIEFLPNKADEVLLLNQRGEVCEGTITTLFVEPDDGGPLLTPPLECGLLAGVLRAEMLETGAAIEQVLLPRDLAAAGAVYVGNSLRGLIRVMLEPLD